MYLCVCVFDRVANTCLMYAYGDNVNDDGDGGGGGGKNGSIECEKMEYRIASMYRKMCSH